MLRRSLGFLFIVTAVLGVIFSIGGIALIWYVREPLKENLSVTFDLIEATINATTAGLTVAAESLTKAQTDVTSLQNTVSSAGKAINDTVPLVDTLRSLMGETLPEAIQSIQTAIDSTQATAATIESTLQLLTTFPILPIDPYQPEVTLTESLGEVSKNLDPIAESFLEIESTLQTSQGNLTLIAAQVKIISRNVGELKTSLYQTQQVLNQYQSVVATLEGQIIAIKSQLPGIINTLSWLGTIFLIWLGIMQIGLLTQGLERIHAQKAAQPQFDLPKETD
jgi:peptidoglycan hydrolase CwlO-like protein